MVQAFAECLAVDAKDLLHGAGVGGVLHEDFLDRAELLRFAARLDERPSVAEREREPARAFVARDGEILLRLDAHRAARGGERDVLGAWRVRGVRADRLPQPKVDAPRAEAEQTGPALGHRRRELDGHREGLTGMNHGGPRARVDERNLMDALEVADRDVDRARAHHGLHDERDRERGHDARGDAEPDVLLDDDRDDAERDRRHRERSGHVDLRGRELDVLHDLEHAAVVDRRRAHEDPRGEPRDRADEEHDAAREEVPPRRLDHDECDRDHDEHGGRDRPAPHRALRERGLVDDDARPRDGGLEVRRRQFGPGAPGRKSRSGSACVVPHAPPPTPRTEPSSIVSAFHSVFPSGRLPKDWRVPAMGST